VPAFSYRAATRQGAVLDGTEDAPSAAVAERALRRRGLVPLRLEPAAAQVGLTATGAGAPTLASLRSPRADVARVVRYLAALVSAGFPLDRALGTAERVAGHPAVRAALHGVRARVRAGAVLADALAEHPRVFPEVAAGVVRAGERGGTLASALTGLADQLEREAALRARVLSALLYPAIMLAAGTAAVAVLLLAVLPRLVSLLADAGAAVPRSTTLLLAAGDWAARWWPACVGAVAVAAVGYSAYRRTRSGRLVVDRLWLGVPLVGGVRRLHAAVRFGRALSALLESGLPVLPALSVAADAVGDAAVAAEVRSAREQVRAGGRLGAALGRRRVFPFLFLQMTDVGEESGRLAEMLGRAANTMEQELERTLDRMVRLVEPALILLLGGAVGFVALALLRAVYSIRAEGM
jgi:general secretion pathway protein F